MTNKRPQKLRLQKRIRREHVVAAWVRFVVLFLLSTLIICGIVVFAIVSANRP